jgi:hypothetical protein
MGLKVETFVGPQTLSEGAVRDVPFRLDNDGSLVVAQSHGNFYQQAKRGNMYVATNPTAATIKAVATLSDTPVLWNPAGSGVCLEIVRLELTQTAVTPAAPSAFLWYSGRAGAEKGTLGAFTAFTSIAPTNMLWGSGRISQARYAVVNTRIAAFFGYLMGTGISQDTWAAAATYWPFQIRVDYNGMFIVPPGQAIVLTATVATVTTFHVNIFYIESPFPGMGA